MESNDIRKIPFFARFILNRMTFYKNNHSVIEDFEETYNDILKSEGRFRADAWCYFSAVNSLIEYMKFTLYWSVSMFRSYLKTAFRNFQRHKGYSFINIYGLAVGITCFIFMMMYVKYELSYDTFHEKSDQLHRIGMFWEGWNFRGSSLFAATNGAMASVLTTEFQEIEYAARILPVKSSLKYEQNSMVEEGIYADKDFFNMFTFPLISGDPNTALQNPFSIVLSKELAEKMFGQENPVGKVLSGFDDFTFTVTGVCQDVPGNSHLQFDFIVSFLTMYAQRDDIDTSWGILNYYNYVLLRENVQYKEFEKKLSILVDKYHGPEDHERYYFLQPVTDIHLDTKVLSRVLNSVDKKHVYLISTIAFLILIIAGVNYINLATSRASLRGKEVGIRKTAGALRSDLMKQYLGESIVTAVFALILALIIIFLLHPYFKAIVGQDISLDILFNPANIAALFGLVVVVGCLSGCYPALLLASFQPATVLKTGAKTGNYQNRFKLRNILVVFQFFVSIVLIVGTLVVYNQIHYIKNKDIGYNRENILIIPLWNSDNADKFTAAKEELVKNSNVISATISDRAPLRASQNNGVQIESDTGEMVRLNQVSHFMVDNDFIELYDIKVKTGRNFSPEYPTDPEQSVIINETAVRMLGLENPIGKNFSGGFINNARIIGVVEDFHFAALTYKIGPMAFIYRPEWAANVLSVKIAGSDVNTTLQYIESTMQKHVDNFVFSYTFLDNEIDKMYDSENRMGSLFTVFSIIALSIASFGLLGLISFIATQKTKEIGIRKILGASVGKIIGLMVKEFVVLVIISGVAALPVSYFVMSKWLQNFAYKIDITIWTMLLSLAIVMLITVFSVIFQVLKAARVNPVDSLRYE